MSYIFPKNLFLQLKHYIQRIYLTLLSTTCVKIHQIPYVIFETISYFSGHSSSVLFQLKHYILLTKISHESAIFQIFHCLNQNSLKFSCHFSNKKCFSSKFGSLSSVMRDNSSALFQLNIYMLFTKVVHQSANFQTWHCSH